MIEVDQVFGAMTAALLTVLLCLVVVSRFVRIAAEHRRGRRVGRWRPVVLQLVSEPDDAQAVLPALTCLDRQTWAALEPTVIELTGKVKGDSRAILVELLVAHGTLGAARTRSTSRRASRRLSAAATLGIIGTEACAPLLVELARDTDAGVRSEAVRAIGRCGDPTAIPVLLSTLRGNPTVPRRIVAQALLSLHDPSVAALVAALNDPVLTVAETAADVLGLRGDIGSVPALLLVAAPGHPDRLRSSAVRALGRIAAPEALELLAGILVQAGTASLRSDAARALGQLGHIGAIPLLATALGDPADVVAETAAASLLDLGPAGRSALVEFASGEPRRATRPARAALVFSERARQPERGRIAP